MADAILVDTDVVSYLLRGDTRAERFQQLLNDRRLTVSFQTVAELYRGAFQNDWGEVRMTRMLRWLAGVTIAPYAPPMAIAWARIMADSRLAGVAMSPQDAWIAATGLVHGLPLLTNNRKDYQHIRGLELPSPDQ